MSFSVMLFVLVLFVAYANGANDNFKGVATLFGANVIDYKAAITLATVATLAGALVSAWFAGALVQVFSGKGLAPDTIVESNQFKLAVAAGAGFTVLLATKLGFPVSTTHGLTGALLGAGFMAAGENLNLHQLGHSFVLPLLVSPVFAALTVIPLYPAARWLTRKLGVGRQTCVCVGPGRFAPIAAQPCGSALDITGSTLKIKIALGEAPACIEKYDGLVFGFIAQKLVDRLHFVSAAAVSFARGLNDTPKIVALAFGATALNLNVSIATIALAMAIGGLLNAHRVAETMSRKISVMRDGQALTANLVTALYVVFASHLGLPVSTTHVAVGAISGIGAANGGVNRGTVGAIVLAWILTLPVAAVAGALAYVAVAALK